jgi:hypothetical protein
MWISKMSRYSGGSSFIVAALTPAVYRIFLLSELNHLRLDPMINLAWVIVPKINRWLSNVCVSLSHQRVNSAQTMHEEHEAIIHLY